MAYKYAGQICIKGRRNAEMKLERTVCFFGLFLLYLFRLLGVSLQQIRTQLFTNDAHLFYFFAIEATNIPPFHGK